MGARQHRRAIALNLYREAERLPPSKAAKIRKRAFRVGQCGSLIRVAKCGECGHLAPGTGEIWSPHPCGARVCSYCERARSMKDAPELIAAMGRVPKRDGYAWRELVFTIDREPSDPMLHTAEALRARTFALLDAAKRVNDAIIARHEGAGFRSKIEISGTGHVHGHGLAYSPFLPIAQIESIVREVPPPPGCRWGRTTIALAQSDEDGLAREIAKYVTKGPSPMSEDWQAGEGRWVMDPVLAARWEIATMGMKLSREYGSLREVLQAKPEPVEPQEQEVPSAEPAKAELPDWCEICWESCFEWVILPAEQTIRAMHARGRRALRGSRWKPPKRE